MNRLGHRRGTLAVLAVSLALLTLSLVPPADAQAQGTKKAGSAAPARPIDLNLADAEELTTVPGIGKALAERIVAFREEHGPFERVEDLLKVKGIGEKSFQKMRPHITVGSKR